MLERLILRAGMVFGVLAFPTLLRKPARTWVSLFIINGVLNHMYDRTLIYTGKLTYPKRAMPNVFRINFIYDYFVCPYLSVWFCQATRDSRIPGMIAKLVLFSLPQGAYEVFLEKKTNLMEFKDGWRWMYSLYLVVVVKIISRLIYAVMEKGKIRNAQVE